MSSRFMKSSPVRKLQARYSLAKRSVSRVFVTEGELERRPPILLNTLPKSGTHLITQMLEVLPGYRSWGEFVASTPSLSMGLKSDVVLAKRIHKAIPGELLSGHIFHSPMMQRSIDASNVVMLFLYRDPRAVFYSEMNYLLYMNKWHRAGRFARSLPTDKERFEFFLYGSSLNRYSKLPFHWPDFSSRVACYDGWLAAPSVYPLKYEDHKVGGESSEDAAWELARQLVSTVGALSNSSTDDLAVKMLENISPAKSHTFRVGGDAEWRARLDKYQVHALETNLTEGRSMIFQRYAII